MALPLAMAFVDCFRVNAAGWYLLCHRDGISDFRPRRIEDTNWRTDGRVRCCVAGIIAAHGVDGLFMCTVMAGVLLVIMGLTGLGTAVKFIPRPVVIGFTNGIAVLIASTQMKDFFGLQLDKVPGVFWLRVEALAGTFIPVI